MNPKTQRILRRLQDPTFRTRMLDKLNQDNLDSVSPISGNEGQQMTVLKDMNDFQGDHDSYVESLGPTV